MVQGTGGPPVGGAVLGAVSLVKPSVELRAACEADLAGIAEQQREALRRREGDAELLAELRSGGFTGPRYRRFETALIEYALEVFQAWLSTGHICVLSTGRGRPLTFTDYELLRLRDKQYRLDLACMTVAEALRTFKRNALIGGGWSPVGGASLTTYFMGATVYAFGNVLRAERSTTIRQVREAGAAQAVHDRTRKVPAGTALDADAPEFGFDPGVAVVSRSAAEDLLQQASPREQTVLRLHLQGYQHAEIAEMTGALSPEAIEGVLYRWRTKERKRRRPQ